MKPRVLVAVACTAALLTGCSKRRDAAPAAAAEDDAGAEVDSRPERVVISRIELQGLPDNRAAALDQRALGRVVAAVLDESGVFAADLGAVPATHQPRVAAIEIGAHYEAADGVARLAVELRVAWADRGSDPAPRESVLVEYPVADEVETDSSLAARMVPLLRSAAMLLARKEAVRSGDAAALAEVFATATPDVELQLWALTVVRDNRRADGFDAAVAALGAPSRDVRERAVGALIALGDPRAVKPIADATATTDVPFVLIAIEAAGSLGGDEAESFLEFLAGGHSDAEVRTAAERALARVKAQPIP